MRIYLPKALDKDLKLRLKKGRRVHAKFVKNLEGLKEGARRVGIEVDEDIFDAFLPEVVYFLTGRANENEVFVKNWYFFGYKFWDKDFERLALKLYLLASSKSLKIRLIRAIKKFFKKSDNPYENERLTRRTAKKIQKDFERRGLEVVSVLHSHTDGSFSKGNRRASFRIPHLESENSIKLLYSEMENRYQGINRFGEAVEIIFYDE
jgi:hypothetical protein